MNEEIKKEEEFGYIKIWESGEIIFDADDVCWDYCAEEEDITNICNVLNCLADGKPIPEGYKVERTCRLYDPEVLRDFAEGLSNDCEPMDLSGSYIMIWEDGNLIFVANDDAFEVHDYWDGDLYDMIDLLTDIIGGKEIPEIYEVERKLSYNDPDVLRERVKDVKEFADAGYIQMINTYKDEIKKRREGMIC